jgi:hypothetical protein
VPQTDLFAMTDAEWNDGLSLKFQGARRLTINAWQVLKSASGCPDLGRDGVGPPGPLWPSEPQRAKIRAAGKF